MKITNVFVLLLLSALCVAPPWAFSKPSSAVEMLPNEAPPLFWNESQHRLETLLRQAMQPGADKKALHERIWNVFGEEWAVMFTDFSGFTRADLELGTPQSLELVYASQMLQYKIVEKYDGIVARIRADGLLILFRKAQSAVDCAVAMQQAIREYNAKIPDARQHLRIYVGIGYGRMLNIGNKEVFGAEVNAAANLQGEAKAGGILVTKAVKERAAESAQFNYGPLLDLEGGAYRVNYK